MNAETAKCFDLNAIDRAFIDNPYPCLPWRDPCTDRRAHRHWPSGPAVSQAAASGEAELMGLARFRGNNQLPVRV